MWEILKLSKYAENGSGSEEEGLLNEKPDTVSSPSTHCCSHCHHSSPGWSLLRQKFLLVLPWILVAALSTLLLVTSLEWMPKQHPEILLYSPVNNLVEYETRTFYRSRGENKSPFQGWPDDEKDRLWRDSYYPGLFTYIDEETASQLPNVTSRVAEPGLEDQYMVVLDVFHQLHCLNFVRQAFYPERYGRSMYHANGTLDYCTWLHIDHCIDQVRQSLMCSADTSIIPVQWNDATKSMRPRVDTIHTCKRYDSLLNWTAGRNLSNFRGAARVVENGRGEFVIEDYLEDKMNGRIEVAESECHAI